MQSQEDDIDKLFDTKASSRTLYWTLGIFFVLLLGGFGYTQIVAADVKAVAEQVNEVVTKGDMDKYQKAIIKAIKGGK